MSNLIYNDNDYSLAKKQKNKYKKILFTILGVYLALSLVSFIYYIQLPYQSDVIKYVKLIQYIITGIFIIILYLFLNLKYKRIKAYYKTMGYINTGLKENNFGEFLRFEKSVEVKENVEFYLMIISEWNERKSEFFERKVLLDTEKPFPDLKEGDKVQFITQGNILVEYEKAEGEQQCAQ